VQPNNIFYFKLNAILDGVFFYRNVRESLRDFARKAVNGIFGKAPRGYNVIFHFGVHNNIILSFIQGDSAAIVNQVYITYITVISYTQHKKMSI